MKARCETGRLTASLAFRVFAAQKCFRVKPPEIKVGVPAGLFTGCAARRRTHARAIFSLLALAGALLLAVGFAACARPERPLRVGANVWPGYEPLFLARSLGYYDRQTIQLINFSSAVEVLHAYRNGAIDVAAVTGDEALQVTETLPGLRIVLVCDFSQGADAILAQPQFQSMRALRGRRIGVEPNALGAYILGRALELSGLTPADVTVVPVRLLANEQAYASDQVDAVVTFDPHRTRLIAAGARSVFDTTQIPGEVVDVLITRPELVESRAVALRSLVHGWFRALDYLRAHPHDAAVKMALRETMTPEEFTATLQGLELPDRAANARLLGPGQDNLVPALRRLSDIMVQYKLLLRPVDPSGLLDARFVPEAK